MFMKSGSALARDGATRTGRPANTCVDSNEFCCKNSPPLRFAAQEP
jgi:hypothetical protein